MKTVMGNVPSRKPYIVISWNMWSLQRVRANIGEEYKGQAETAYLTVLTLTDRKVQRPLDLSGLFYLLYALSVFI